MSPMPLSQSPLDDPVSSSVTVEDVSAQVRSWVEAAALRPGPRPAKMLSDLLRDAKGLDFTLGFVDRVIRTEDPRAAAVELRRLAQDPPAFLPAALRRVLGLGGLASQLAPTAVVPTAQATMRRMVSHLILDARPRPLSASIARLTADGTKLNINLLGEAVLGAQRRPRAGCRACASWWSVKISTTCPSRSPRSADHLPLWAAAETVDHTVETLLPLYLEAARRDRPTFLNMDMEEYRDLELTLQVFEKLLDRPELEHLHAGIVLQAYLPDAPSAMARVRRFAERRVARQAAHRSRCAWSRARTWRWSRSTPRCTGGRKHRCCPRRRPTRSTSGCCSRAWIPPVSRPSTWVWPATTSSTSPSRIC